MVGNPAKLEMKFFTACVYVRGGGNMQCPKLTPACPPVACKFIVGRVEITYVHARLASKILRTINNVITEKMIPNM